MMVVVGDGLTVVAGEGFTVVTGEAGVGLTVVAGEGRPPAGAIVVVEPGTVVVASGIVVGAGVVVSGVGTVVVVSGAGIVVVTTGAVVVVTTGVVVVVTTGRRGVGGMTAVLLSRLLSFPMRAVRLHFEAAFGAISNVVCDRPFGLTVTADCSNSSVVSSALRPMPSHSMV